MEQVSIQNLSHIGDILAIPFFLLLTIYLYQLKNKTLLEYILLLFAVSGFVLDTLFTYDFLTSR
jgi:hypothetical protein